MNKIDPRLRQLARQESSVAFSMIERVGFALPTLASDFLDSVDVLVRCRDTGVVGRLRETGVAVRFVIEGPHAVVSGSVPVSLLGQLNDVEGVERVEASRVMVRELNVSRIETRAETVHVLDPTVRGKGALVAIIDGGIDYTHPDFRHDDGSSRILFLWDQGAPPLTGNPGVLYGREFRKEDLDAALDSGGLVHRDSEGHGTHVAGIAASNGRARNGEFTGLAPEADLIVVALRTEEGVSLGRSGRAVDAFAYVVSRAQELDRPVAINLSQGMNGGGHSGETVLETGLDNLARQPAVAIIKSAGNEQEWRIHAGGNIAKGETVTLEISVGDNHVNDDVLEVWYDGGDDISLALQPPGSAPLAFVAPGQQQDFVTHPGNQLSIDFDLDADDTGDTLATIFLSRGNASFVQPGTWKVLLRGDAIKSGRYDAWIERTSRKRSGAQTRFVSNSADNTRTISIPGTARHLITVGSYVTRTTPGSSLPLGEVSSFSSRGPTRYGFQKPDITAPGDIIVSTLSSQSSEVPNPDHHYTPMAGTSMAAPHVTGAAALVLSLRPSLNCEQVRQILTSTARHDGLAASAPDNAWGSGKLDVEAAIARTRTAHFPLISNVVISGPTLSWKTDAPTTSAVRFHTHQRKLELGKALNSRTDLMLRTDHSLTLDDLDSGTYYCEILAFASSNLVTTDDRDGAFYVVEVP
jgi:subtilisin family serine protease